MELSSSKIRSRPSYQFNSRICRLLSSLINFLRNCLPVLLPLKLCRRENYCQLLILPLLYQLYPSNCWLCRIRSYVLWLFFTRSFTLSSIRNFFALEQIFDVAFKAVMLEQELLTPKTETPTMPLRFRMKLSYLLIYYHLWPFYLSFVQC